MRLNEEKAQRPQVILEDTKVFSFQPMVFIEGLLTLYFGEKGRKWEEDKETDRLFVYTLASITGTEDPQLIKDVTYRISQMEDDSKAEIDPDYIDSFHDGINVYKRFASRTGGVFSTFHQDGGGTLIFTDRKTAKQIPISHFERLAQKKFVVNGTSRPFIGLSLTEMMIYKRMYLRRINQELDQIILFDKNPKKTVVLMKEIHMRSLKFRAKFTSAKVSTTRAGKEQYVLWNQVLGIDQLQKNLNSSLTELNQYYSDVEEKRNQRHLDYLTIVLGCLGATSVVIDMNSFYTQTELTIDQGVFYIPIISTSGFMLLAFAIILWLNR